MSLFTVKCSSFRLSGHHLTSTYNPKVFFAYFTTIADSFLIDLWNGLRKAIFSGLLEHLRLTPSNSVWSCSGSGCFTSSSPVAAPSSWILLGHFYDWFYSNWAKHILKRFWTRRARIGRAIWSHLSSRRSAALGLSDWYWSCWRPFFCCLLWRISSSETIWGLRLQYALARRPVGGKGTEIKAGSSHGHGQLEVGTPSESSTFPRSKLSAFEIGGWRRLISWCSRDPPSTDHRPLSQFWKAIARNVNVFDHWVSSTKLQWILCWTFIKQTSEISNSIYPLVSSQPPIQKCWMSSAQCSGMASYLKMRICSARSAACGFGVCDHIQRSSTWRLRSWSSRNILLTNLNFFLAFGLDLSYQPGSHPVILPCLGHFRFLNF